MVESDQGTNEFFDNVCTENCITHYNEPTQNYFLGPKVTIIEVLVHYHHNH